MKDKRIEEIVIRLKSEEAKRLELEKVKSKYSGQCEALKKIIEKLKNDIITYKQQALEELRKGNLIQKSNEALQNEITKLQQQIEQLKKEKSQHDANQIGLKHRQSLLEEVIEQDQWSYALPNDGNMNKFKLFVDDLYESGLNQQEIKNELIAFFEVLDQGYRLKISKMQQLFKDHRLNKIESKASIKSSARGMGSPISSLKNIDHTLNQLMKIPEESKSVLGMGHIQQSNHDQLLKLLREKRKNVKTLDYTIQDIKIPKYQIPDKLVKSRSPSQSELLKFKQNTMKLNSQTSRQKLNLGSEQSRNLSPKNSSNINKILPSINTQRNVEFMYNHNQQKLIDPLKSIRHQGLRFKNNQDISFIDKMYKGKMKSGLEFGTIDDSSEYNDEYSNLSKSTLVQESNIFNEKNLKGEEFPDSEKSQVFFNVTKLFQVNTPGTQNLRRLMYVFIKELQAKENEVFVVISQLTKDVAQNENEMYKANALRVLTKIIDELYVQSLEKYLKQSLIDKSNHVVSAALVSLVNLYKKGGHSMDVVKKSINELQDKLFNSGDGNLQYQALIILYELKKNDQMSVLKLLYQLTSNKIYNAITKCQLLRYIKQSLLQNTMIDQRTVKTFLAYTEACLTKEDDAVQFEAAKTMCELFEVFGPVVNVELPFQILIQLASNTSKPVNKYAALRVINRVATRQPSLVGMCQSDLESLITDMNRSVASLAISTLLKTCNEDSVQKLLKQISHYLPDLGLDFKIETIQSTALLYHRLPQKADVLLKFLTDCLKDDGNAQFRESVVDTIMEICPSQREVALMILAEHIEDCEHAHIQTKIINFLAEEGPKSKNPSSYIRFIYNRVNLEKSVIRAAAVSALAAFAHKVPSLRRNILLLLNKCLNDSDDEVRERAYFYINLLQQQGDEGVIREELNVEDNVPNGEVVDEKEEIRDFVFDAENMIDIDALEYFLIQRKDELLKEEEPLHIDITQMIVSKKVTTLRQANQIKQHMEVEEQEMRQQANQQASLVNNQLSPGQSQHEDENYVAMTEHPELVSIIQSSKHIYSSYKKPLNDHNAEYIVETIKHFFDTVIIVQYQITNTLEDQILSEVKLKITNVESSYNLKVQKVGNLQPDESIKYGDKRYVYAVFSKQHCEHPYPLAKISQKLQLKITEIDVDSQDELGSYEEDYNLDEVSIAVKDYIRAYHLPSGSFKDTWESVGAGENPSEVIQTFQIPFKTMEEAVQGVVKFFGMSVCEGTDKVNVTEKVHNLLMSGLFYGSEIVLVRAQIGFNQDYGCVLKVTIRSNNETVSGTLLEAIN